MKVLRFVFFAMFFLGSGVFLLPLAYDSALFFVHQHANEAFARVHLRFIPDEQFNIHLKAALKENEIDLANIIREIGLEQGIEFDPALIVQLDKENGSWQTVSRNSSKILEGAKTGEITSGYGMVGALGSDILGISDFRDLSNEFEAYPDYNSFNVGLSLVGVVGTALTVSAIFNGGSSALAGGPLRSSATAIKGAKKAGKLSKKLEKFVSGHMDNVVDKNTVNELALAFKKIDIDSINKKQADELLELSKKSVNIKALEQLASGVDDLRVISGSSGFLGLSRTLAIADDFNDTARLSKLSKATKSRYAGYITLAPKLAKSITKALRILLEAIASLISALIWLLGLVWYFFKAIRLVFLRRA